MTLSTLTTLAIPISFISLLALMLLYWYQAAIFSCIRYKRITFSLLLGSILLLTGILVIRWVESNHFPLSNLYESLVFLSWSSLISQLLLQYNSKPFTPAEAFITKGDSLPLKEVDSYSLSTRARGVDQGGDQRPSRGGNQRIVHPETSPAMHVDNVNYNNNMDLTSMIGAVISPVALLTYGFALLKLPKELQQATTLLPALQSNWLIMHVTIMILSYAALICGSILAMAFLLVTRIAAWSSVGETPRLPSLAAPQNRIASHVLHEDVVDQSSIQTNNSRGKMIERIHSTRPPFGNSSMRSLTSLHLASKLDNLSYRLLGLGFPLLTIGILSGAVWANEAWGSYWSWDPKETWALITWLVFAIYLHARITKGWSGQRPAVIATLGFFVVWFCYLGVNLLGTGLHSYGWFSHPL